MSQPTSPGETQQTNPVGTQEVSPGSVQTLPPGAVPLQPANVQAPQQFPVNPKPTPTPLQEASQNAHDDALNGRVSQQQLNTAVAEAVKKQFEVTEAWQPKKAAVQFVIECPSGQTALVKHLGTRDLLRVGLLEEMDRFSKQLFPKAIDAQGNPVDKVEEVTEEIAGIWLVLRDPEKRRKFYDMTNRLISISSVEPKVVNDGVALRHNEDTNEMEEVFGCEVDSIDEQIKLFGKPVPALKEGESYAGAIDFADRMAFYQELNKPLSMIEPFRNESNAVLAGMEPGQGSPVQAERPV